MKIDVSFKSKSYKIEGKEGIPVIDILSAIKRRNKMKKSKKLFLCNQNKKFEESEILGEIHDSEFFYIIEIAEIKKSKKPKKAKKEDIIEMIRHCTGAKNKIDIR